MRMELLYTCVLVLLIAGLANAAKKELDTSTISTLTICHLYENRYAFKCTVANVASIATGYKMELTKKADLADIGAVSDTKDVSGEDYIIRVAEKEALATEFTCSIFKEGETAKKSTVSPAVASDSTKYCIEGTTSTLTITKKIKNEFKCAVSGVPQPDVSKEHVLILKKGNDNVGPDSGVADIADRTSITRKLTTYDESHRNEYKCEIHVTGKPEKKSTLSAADTEGNQSNTKPAKDSASGAVTSLTLMAGCVAAALSKLTY